MLKTWQILVIGCNLVWSAFLLQGCGQTGPLYLPPTDVTKTVKAHAPTDNGNGSLKLQTPRP
jgi:predicted small lipoprotein YifL